MNEVIAATPAEAKNERFFFKIVSTSIALVSGFAAASYEALEKNAAGFTFRFLAETIMAFAAGAGGGWLLWKFLESESKSLHRKAIVFLIVAGIAGFLYPLRFVSGDRRKEVAWGLADAVVTLSLIGYMIYRIGRFFKDESVETDAVAKDAGKAE